MIVGAVAGVFSLSDYRVDVGALASVHTPASILEDHSSWLADGRDSKDRLALVRAIGKAPEAEELYAVSVPAVVCASQSPDAAEPVEAGLCVIPEPAQMELVDQEFVVDADSEPAQEAEPTGPDLPLGIAVARDASAQANPDRLQHWPGTDAFAGLVGLPVGPEFPDAIAMARASDRLAVKLAEAERLRGVERARTAQIEWVAEHAVLVVDAAEVVAEARALEEAASVAGVETEIAPPAFTADADHPALLILEGIQSGKLVAEPELLVDADRPDGPEIDPEMLIARHQETERLAEVEANRFVGPQADPELLAQRHETSRVDAEAVAQAERDVLAKAQAEADAIAAAADALAAAREDARAGLEAQELARTIGAVEVIDPDEIVAGTPTPETVDAEVDADAPVGPDIDGDLLAKRREAATREVDVAAVDAAVDEVVGPPLPAFLEICKARFDDPFGFGEQTIWESSDAVAAAQPEPVEMTVYVTSDGEEVDYDPDAAAALPFDPLAVTPFGTDGVSKTRRAFEDMLAADEGLHTVRYIKELTHELRKGETLSEVLAATGLSGGELDRWVRATQKVYDCNRVYAGQELKLTVDMPDRALKRLQLDSGRDSLVIVETDGEKVLARKQDIIYERSLRVVDAYIDRSLYVSAIDKRIPDRIISEMAEILGWDINFGRDLQPGSSFRVIYEQLTRVDTADTISGRVLAVEVSNRGDLYEGFYFERGENGDGGYYDRDGESLGRSFLRFPVSYSRVSSPFSTARYHPVLKRRIPHYGVDFAAPTGTPVRAVADGKVLKSGWYGGNGRFVKIRHDSVYESGYAHLSRIASGATANAPVKKGQVIGYVGSTGLATGPHLHFAMYQSGKYIDPMRTELPRSQSLAGRELTGFKMKVAMMDRAYADSGEGEERSTQVAAAEIPEDDSAR
jgi:murein DD-endopeptidase MepM/ murein hydrolase activator NlpD